MNRKTPVKTPVAGAISAGPRLVAQKHGGRIKQGGNPGNKGGPGRPKKEWTVFCQELVDDPDVQQSLLTTAKSTTRGQLGAVQLAASYAVGKPVERVQHSGSVERVVRIVRDPLPPLPKRTEFPVATVRVAKRHVKA